MKELAFYVTNAEEINRKYRGKHTAIVGNKVVASGTTLKKSGKKQKRNIQTKNQF
jgi:hypothetical protein